MQPDTFVMTALRPAFYLLPGKMDTREANAFIVAIALQESGLKKRRQLGAGGVQARTFHSAALRQLQYFWPKAVGGEVPRLVERKVQLVAEAAARCRVRLDRNELRRIVLAPDHSSLYSKGDYGGESRR